MTTIAADNDKLRELDADTRRAWDAYTERLRELTGDEYERVEHEAWELLQSELESLERQRQQLVHAAD